MNVSVENNFDKIVFFTVKANQHNIKYVYVGMEKNKY